MLSKQHATSRFHGLVGDAVGVKAPTQPREENDDDDDPKRHTEGHQNESLLHQHVDEIALIWAHRAEVLLRDEELKDAIAEIGKEDATDDEYRQAAAK